MRAEAVSVDQSPTRRRQLIAAELVSREYKARRIGRMGLAEAAGVYHTTITNLTQGRNVDEETWIAVGGALNWGNFLDYVRQGNIPAVSRCETVAQLTRDYAIERLRDVAENE